ncbi:MAG: nucleotide exchange factor GrpE [Actinobacteria bacterium]|nr:nucleotide exchange factor GrpE [Actinomycetota bacterium]
MNLVDTVFDPSVADAVVHEPADDESGASETRVVEVMRTGYLWKGRVLRAAMVKVKG